MFGWKTCAKPHIWLITSHEYVKQINKIIHVTRTSQKQHKSQKARGSCWHLEFSQLFLYCPVCIHDAFLPPSICAYMSLIHVISSTCFILCGLWGCSRCSSFPFPITAQPVTGRSRWLPFPQPHSVGDLFLLKGSIWLLGLLPFASAAPWTEQLLWSK